MGIPWQLGIFMWSVPSCSDQVKDKSDIRLRLCSLESRCISPRAFLGQNRQGLCYQSFTPHFGARAITRYGRFSQKVDVQDLALQGNGFRVLN